MCDLLGFTTTGGVPRLVWGSTMEGGDISLAGAGRPVDMTGLRHTDVVTVVVVDVAMADVTGMDRGERMIHGCWALLSTGPAASPGDDNGEGGSLMGGVWLATDLLDGPPPELCDVGVPDRLCVAFLGAGAPGLLLDARVIRRTEPLGPVPAAWDGGGVRSGILLAIPPRLGSPDPGGVGVGRGGARVVLLGPEAVGTDVPGGVLLAAALSIAVLVIVGAVLLPAAVLRASGGVVLAAVTAAYVGDCADGAGVGAADSTVGKAVLGSGGREAARRARSVPPDGAARDRARTLRSRAPFPSSLAGDCRSRVAWDPVPGV